MEKFNNLQKSMEKLLEREGKSVYVVYYVQIIGHTGKKGIKLVRIEDTKGNVINIQEFLKENKLDAKLFGAEFIGARGATIGNKIFSKKIFV